MSGGAAAARAVRPRAAVGLLAPTALEGRACGVCRGHAPDAAVGWLVFGLFLCGRWDAPAALILRDWKL